MEFRFQGRWLASSDLLKSLLFMGWFSGLGHGVTGERGSLAARYLISWCVFILSRRPSYLIIYTNIWRRACAKPSILVPDELHHRFPGAPNFPVELRSVLHLS